MKSQQQLHCNLCSGIVSCNKHFLVESHRNTSKHQKALGIRSELLIPHTLLTFLKSNNADLLEKITKAFLYDKISLYKLNNKHIKNQFQNIGSSLSIETNCRKTVLQFSEDELQQITNTVHEKPIFLVVVESNLSGIQYLNSLVEA